jgi:DNA-binding protein WhiA
VSTLDHATARVAVQRASSLGLPVAPRRMAAGTRRHMEVAVDPQLAAGWSWADAKACDHRAFLRGVLLAGSVSLTASGPHVEFVLRDPRRAAELRRRLAEVDVRAAAIRRRGRHVVYVKGREQLGALLRLTGANRSLLDLEAEGVSRDVRNHVNRLLNAEEANLGRTVRAADRQLRAIDRLERGGELGRLPDALREAAVARRRHPDADLDTLASWLGVSRSGANHRLRRLVAMAEEEEETA